MKNTEAKPLPSVSKRLFRMILYTVYPAYILHSLVIAPIYTVCSSNVAVPEGITVMLYFLLVLIDLLAFFVSFSVIIYGMCNISPKDMKKLFILIFASPFFKYLLKFIISPFIDGLSVDNIIIDLYSYGVSGILEVLQYALVILLTFGYSKKYREQKEILRKYQGSEDIKNRFAVAPLVPFKKTVSLKNPLQRGAIFSALVIVVGRVASLAISDMYKNWKITGINQYISFFAPYIMEIIVGCVGYFLMLYLFIRFYTGTKDE